ncbi:hypothetical protein B566_EDAN005123 [Ephemera danica]|nr:hypothetical protein B566_EDAN005123 [Ephemera danica]
MAATNGDSVILQNGLREKTNKRVNLIKIDIDLDEIVDSTIKVSDLLKGLPDEKNIWQEAGVHPFDLSYYSEDSVKALQLKLVRDVEEIEDDDTAFNPEMTYQLFGENERVIGYHGLKIRLYYGAGSLTTLLNLSYDDKVETKEPGDLEADDVMKMIGEKLEPGFLTNMSDFTKALEKEKEFKPEGNLVNKFTVSSEEQDDLVFEVYSADVVAYPGFKSYNERLQTFLLWFIEAASFVDIDDDKWRFFVMYEKYNQDGGSCYAIAGFISVYEFYCYPNNIRPRISQMLVLPPFQVESPSEEFQRVRDYVDCLTLAGLPNFSPDKLKKGLTKEMVADAKERLKMSKKQVQRVVNILRLQNCDEDNSREMEVYLSSLKEQVDKPHQMMVARAKRKKLFEHLSAKQVLDAMPSLNHEYRDSLLERATSLMLEQYHKVLERLERE